MGGICHDIGTTDRNNIDIEIQIEKLYRRQTDFSDKE